MSEKTVKLKLHPAFYNNIKTTIEQNKWMGYMGIEEFVIDSVRQRLEFIKRMAQYAHEILEEDKRNL